MNQLKGLLRKAAELVISHEEVEASALEIQLLLSQLASDTDLTEARRELIMSIGEKMESFQRTAAVANREQTHDILRYLIEQLIGKQ